MIELKCLGWDGTVSILVSDIRKVYPMPKVNGVSSGSIVHMKNGDEHPTSYSPKVVATLVNGHLQELAVAASGR